MATRRLKAYPAKEEKLSSFSSTRLIQGAECEKCILEGGEGSTPRSIIRLTSLGKEARKPLRKDSRKQIQGAAPEVSVTEMMFCFSFFHLGLLLKAPLFCFILLFHDPTFFVLHSIPLANLCYVISRLSCTRTLTNHTPLLDSNKVSRRVTGSKALKNHRWVCQRRLAGVILAPRQRPLA
ncbi:hypothetical protein GGI43DRAFT_178418 [Trichoderma evansii]